MEKLGGGNVRTFFSGRRPENFLENAYLQGEFLPIFLSSDAMKTFSVGQQNTHFSIYGWGTHFFLPSIPHGLHG